MGNVAFQAHNGGGLLQFSVFFTFKIILVPKYPVQHLSIQLDDLQWSCLD